MLHAHARNVSGDFVLLEPKSMSLWGSDEACGKAISECQRHGLVDGIPLGVPDALSMRKEGADVATSVAIVIGPRRVDGRCAGRTCPVEPCHYQLRARRKIV